VKKVFSKTNVAVGTAGMVAAILAAVVHVEGGYSNHPKDPGGETNHGITQVVARANGYAGSMRHMRVSTALRIYEEQYISKPGFKPLIEIQPLVGYKLVDIGVNTGVRRASLWLQKSLNALSRGGRDYALIAVDGVVGPGTLAAYKALEAKRGKRLACELVIKALEGWQTSHYLSLNMPEFTVGWLDKRVGNVDLTECTE